MKTAQLLMTDLIPDAAFLALELGSDNVGLSVPEIPILKLSAQNLAKSSCKAMLDEPR
jgi:hypothetical protein